MDLSEVIQEFKARVVSLYGARFQKLIFDGPLPGGDEGEEVFPLLVVLEGDLLLDRESERIEEIVRDIHFVYGVFLSALPVSASIDNKVYAPLFWDRDRPWIRA